MYDVNNHADKKKSSSRSKALEKAKGGKRKLDVKDSTEHSRQTMVSTMKRGVKRYGR